MARRWLRCLWGLILLLMLVAQPVYGQAAHPAVEVLRLEGPLTQAMYQYLERGLQVAENRGTPLVVLELDTPGGSIGLMNGMVEIIRASKVPVVVYVSPRGAMAGSAGTMITLAGHFSAMAPETTIGAASPVGSQGEDIGETMARKEKEILRATVRSLAENRRPEAIALGEDMIENARAVSSTEAFNIGLVDYIAVDLTDLLRQLDGATAHTASGPQTLSTTGLTVSRFEPSFMEQLLSLLTNPNVVFLLLAVGVQAILIELSTPGGWVAGFLGVVSVALAVYGLGILPVNWFGALFLLIAFVLFALEIKTPTAGALTVAGVASFIAGGLILFNSPGVPDFQRVSVPLVVATAVLTAAAFFTVVSIGVRAQRIPVQSGQRSLVGQSGVARSAVNPRGTVQVGSELWTAEMEPGQPPVARGAAVRVVGIEGVNVVVRSDEGEQPPSA